MKLSLSILCLALVIGTVTLSVYLQNHTAEGMLTRLEKCSDDAVKGDMEAMYEDFYAFSDFYDEHRKVLALFVHTDRVEEIDALKAEVTSSLENGEYNADDTDFDTIAASVSKLIDCAKRIKETNTLSVGNIF